MSRSLRAEFVLPSFSPRARQFGSFVLNCRVPQRNKFIRTIETIEAGIRDRLHLGAQLYVSLADEVLIDAGFGEARPGNPITNDTFMLWFSAGKPLTAVVVAQFVERGSLHWDTRIAQVIPEFSRGGKEQITIAHVLTHTAGLHALDPIDHALSWKEKLGRICELALPLDWVPGERAAYSAAAGWYLLGEIIARISGDDLGTVLRGVAFRNSGLERTRLCFAEDEFANIQEKSAFVYDTSAEPVPLEFWNTKPGFTNLVPGGSARGPVGELGKLYETLLSGGGAMLKPETVRALTSHQRAGLFDETFQFKTDVGYGFILNSNRDGIQMPYGYGRAAAHGTFGHSGNQSSCAFADPDRKLVAAWCCNGMPGERKHQQRQRAINNAIYQDLGFA